MTTERPNILRHGLRRWGPVLTLTVAYMALVLPAVLLGWGYSPQLWDQTNFHEPTIRAFAESWPQIDLASYQSATAPGLHIFLATLLHFTDSELSIRLATLVFGWLLIIVVYMVTRRLLAAATGGAVRDSGWIAGCLTLPLAVTPYTLGSAIWIATDNTALLLVVLAMALSVLFPVRPRWLLLAGLSAAGAVFVRQIHLWALAPVGFAGLLASPLAKWVPPAFRDDSLHTPRTWTNLVMGTVAAAMPAAVITWLIMIWGGLMPKVQDIRDMHAQGANPATFAFGLALTGVLGGFFVLTMADPLGVIRRARRGMLIGAIIGLAAALPFPTSYLEPIRSAGPLWRAAQATPAIADRSIVITLLAPVGGAVLAAMLVGATERGRRAPSLALLLCLIGWMCAQAANAMAWQRYFEPMLLILLSWFSALAWHDEHTGARQTGLARRLIGPMVLTLILGVGAVVNWQR